MNNINKRIFALLLVLIMCISMFPVSVLADEGATDEGAIDEADASLDEEGSTTSCSLPTNVRWDPFGTVKFTVPDDVWDVKVNFLVSITIYVNGSSTYTDNNGNTLTYKIFFYPIKYSQSQDIEFSIDEFGGPILNKFSGDYKAAVAFCDNNYTAQCDSVETDVVSFAVPSSSLPIPDNFTKNGTTISWSAVDGAYAYYYILRDENGNQIGGGSTCLANIDTSYVSGSPYSISVAALSNNPTEVASSDYSDRIIISELTDGDNEESQINILTSDNFPDSIFLSKLNELYPDGLTKEQAAEVTELDVSVCNISSLKGIEFFTGLTTLNCCRNKLTDLDISLNTSLVSLNCYSNRLTSIDLTKNLNLTGLSCFGNSLADLDLSKNTELTYLDCGTNNLNTLDVSNNLKLETLYCYSNKLTNLNLNNNIQLTELSCGNNALESLDLSLNTNLESLICNNNNFASLDLSANENLRSVFLSSQNIYVESYGQTIDMQTIVGAGNIGNITEVSGGTYDSDTGVITVDSGAEAVSYVYNTNSSKSDTMTVNIKLINGEIVISRQPESCTVNAGETLSLYVTAEYTGKGELSYLWKFYNASSGKWEDATGFNTSYTSRAFIVDDVSTDLNDYKFKCIITDPNGNSISTEEATVTVLVASGTCGDNLAWTLDENGMLTISGTGDMYDYSYNIFNTDNRPPWSSYCSSIYNISILDDVTKIGDFAFYGCSALTRIEIGASVTSIGQVSLSSCGSLNTIDVSEENTEFSSENGVLFNKQKTVLVRCPEGKSGSYSIPGSVTYIADNAFSLCKNLTNVLINDIVTGIGGGAFAYCNELTSITIPSSVKNIDYSAFYDCSSIVEITFKHNNNSELTIAENAFISTSTDSISTKIKVPDTENINPAISGYDWKGSGRNVTFEKLVIWGDVNLDGKVDVQDVYLLRKAAAGLINLKDDQKAVADVYTDGRYNALDVNILRRYIAGIVTQLPVSK